MELGSLVNVYLNKQQLAESNTNALYFEDAFDYLEKAPDSKYLCGFGEAFDDFIILVTYSSLGFTFFWKLQARPFFEYSDLKQGTGKCLVEESVFLMALKEYEAYIVKASANTDRPIKPLI